VPTWRPTTPSAAAGVFLIVAAALMLLIRLPEAVHSFSAAASAASGRDQLGGALATADEVGLSDAFVSDAFAHIPLHASFVVALPADEPAAEAKDGVNPTTFSAAGPLFEDFLMPRRVATRAIRGVYVICFYCDPGWNARTHWITPLESGGRIGVVDR
jgi:hypothetical protein